MIDLTKTINILHFTIKLNRSFRADLDWWRMFLPHWNGISAIHREVDTELYTDSSDVGIGAIYGNQWFMSPFVGATYHLVLKSITWRELFAIIKAIATWCNDLANKSMKLIRTLFFICAKFNIECKCQHIPGIANIGSDHLSRNRVAKCISYHPTAYPNMTAKIYYIWSTINLIYVSCITFRIPSDDHWVWSIVWLGRLHAMSTRDVYNLVVHGVRSSTRDVYNLVVHGMRSSTRDVYILVVHGVRSSTRHVYTRCMHEMSTFWSSMMWGRLHAMSTRDVYILVALGVRSSRRDIYSLVAHGVWSSTRDIYNSAQRRYRRLCDIYGLTHRPHQHQRTTLCFHKTDYNELLVWSPMCLAHFDCFISAEIDANLTIWFFSSFI